MLFHTELFNVVSILCTVSAILRFGLVFQKIKKNGDNRHWNRIACWILSLGPLNDKKYFWLKLKINLKKKNYLYFLAYWCAEIIEKSESRSAVFFFYTTHPGGRIHTCIMQRVLEVNHRLGVLERERMRGNERSENQKKQVEKPECQSSGLSSYDYLQSCS